MTKGLNYLRMIKKIINKKEIFLLVLSLLFIFYIYTNWHSGRVYTNGPEDEGLILGRVIPKTQKNGTWCLLA